MIPTVADLFATWKADWQKDLDANLAEQTQLKQDEQALRAILAAFDVAASALFPPQS